jgi:hypothetical protein
VVSGQRDIHAQRLDYRGTPVGAEIVVAGLTDNETNPDVAMDPAGNFVVYDNQAGDIFLGEFSRAGALRAYHRVSSDDSDRSAFSIDGFGTYRVIDMHLFAAASRDILAALAGWSDPTPVSERGRQPTVNEIGVWQEGAGPCWRKAP